MCLTSFWPIEFYNVYRRYLVPTYILLMCMCVSGTVWEHPQTKFLLQFPLPLYLRHIKPVGFVLLYFCSNGFDVLNNRHVAPDYGVSVRTQNEWENKQTDWQTDGVERERGENNLYIILYRRKRKKYRHQGGNHLSSAAAVVSASEPIFQRSFVVVGLMIRPKGATVVAYIFDAHTQIQTQAR